MQAIRAKRTAGLALTREDNNRLRKLPAIEAKLKELYRLKAGECGRDGTRPTPSRRPAAARYSSSLAMHRRKN